jgi:hypothetical protein
MRQHPRRQRNHSRRDSSNQSAAPRLRCCRLPPRRERHLPQLDPPWAAAQQRGERRIPARRRALPRVSGQGATQSWRSPERERYSDFSRACHSRLTARVIANGSLLCAAIASHRSVLRELDRAHMQAIEWLLYDVIAADAASTRRVGERSNAHGTSRMSLQGIRMLGDGGAAELRPFKRSRGSPSTRPPQPHDETAVSRRAFSLDAAELDNA